MKANSIALVLVTYNRVDLLHALLQRIADSNWKYDRFVLINNASTDSTGEVANEFEVSLRLELVNLNENLGHGAGIAVALDQLLIGSKPEWVVFMEDDSIPEPRYLDFLIQRISSSNYSMIASKGSKVGVGRRTQVSPQPDELMEVDFGLFDGAIAKFKDLGEVGFPVRDWFMMFDDFEYCYRIRQAGFKLGVCKNPHVKILHEGWGGGASHSAKWRAYYQSRNFIHFVRLHFSGLILLDYLILQGKRLIGGIFTSNGLELTKYRLMGIRAGILGKKGRSLDITTLREIE
ncbi:glycosyltransferase [Algoriphagus sp.]|uniref:glycosyltransferase family 2 protein n=1 Tax=Algoriphagus sp. TaxID=1872435 RepID=UPI00326D853B